jgi:hypothetical protein
MPSDAKRIKKIIHDGRDAIILKDLAQTMNYVSYHYKDQYGFSYLYIKQTLKSLFERNDAFEIEVSKIRVDVNDKRAEAQFLLKLKSGKGERERYLLGSVEVPESVVFTLEKERLKWKVIETYFPTREGIVF